MRCSSPAQLMFLLYLQCLEDKEGKDLFSKGNHVAFNIDTQNMRYQEYWAFAMYERRGIFTYGEYQNHKLFVTEN